MAAINRYVIRKIGATLVLSNYVVSSTDDIEIPPDGSVLNDVTWQLLAQLCGAGGLDVPDAHAAIIATITKLANAAGLTVVNNIDLSTLAS